MSHAKFWQKVLSSVAATGCGRGSSAPGLCYLPYTFFFRWLINKSVKLLQENSVRAKNKMLSINHMLPCDMAKGQFWLKCSNRSLPHSQKKKKKHPKHLLLAMALTLTLVLVLCRCGWPAANEISGQKQIMLKVDFDFGQAASHIDGGSMG